MTGVDGRLRGDDVGWAAKVVYHVLQLPARLLVLIYFRGYARNARRLPRRGAVIIAPVHRSNLDVPTLGATCPRRLRYFAKDGLFVNRFWTWFLTLIGGFPVNRDRFDRNALEAAGRVLGRGEALVMFPEGERKSGPVVQPFLDGVAYVAIRHQVPILPVGIGGSERAMPKGALVPRPRQIVYLYGELVQPPSLAGKRVPRAEVRDLTARLHQTVQDLFDEAQRIAGCPNP